MKAQLPQKSSEDLFRSRLDNQINMRHPLVQLTSLIDWEALEVSFSGYFPSERGRPALPSRLVAGLLYLQHAFDQSDEQVVANWVENPYWQYFTGEIYLQTEAPVDPSSLTRWRQRLGQEGVERLLKESIEAAVRGKAVKASSMQKVIADTTVMEKAIAYPTDAKLLNRARELMVKEAQRLGIGLRQNYNRECPRLAIQAGRYAHAKQYQRMRQALKALRTRVGRVYRDIERQLSQVKEAHRPKLLELLQRVERVLTQQRSDKNKLYALHAPEVECISKGKARNRFEFGTKVSLISTLKEGLIIGAQAMPGNPYDGHTLSPALIQTQRLTGILPEKVVVDKGYKGVKIEGVSIYRSGQKRGITRGIKAMIKRRSAIEPIIGHMKAEGKLDRNWLKGATGDMINAILCGAGRNIRLILKKLRLFCTFLLLLFFVDRANAR